MSFLKQNKVKAFKNCLTIQSESPPFIKIQVLEIFWEHFGGKVKIDKLIKTQTRENLNLHEYNTCEYEGSSVSLEGAIS